jgi:hypothetical protein
MERITWQALVVFGLALVLAAGQGACGADDAAGWDEWDTGRDASDSGWDYGADADADADASDVAPEVDTWLPPEDEEDPDFNAPQGSNRYVYLSNPLGDNVVVIDSQRLTVDLVEVGDTPTQLKTLGMRDAAAVIDTGSDDVAIVRTSAPLDSDVTFEPIAPGANALSISPDGSYGVTFYDVDARTGTRPPNMQEVTLLVFEPATEQRAVRTTVRALPVAVDWTSDSTHAFVIGWDGLTIVDFTELGDGYRPTHVSFGTVPSDPANPDSPHVAREVDDVEVAGDGAIAVLSTATVAELQVLELATQELVTVPLPAPPTDIDLADDGSFALAALRSTGEVARIELADPREPTVFVTSVPGVIAGQVALTPDGARAVVFTTAADVETIALLDMLTGDSTVIPLQKKVRAVATTPDGEVAVVIHEKEPGDPDDPSLDPVDDLDEIIDRTYGFSLVRFGDELVVRHETPCDPGAWLVYAEEQLAFLTLRDDRLGVRDVLVADLVDFVADTVHLGSPPASLGLAPLTRKVFVGQEHATGRITFIPADGGPVQTLTGFELNDWIVD